MLIQWRLEPDLKFLIKTMKKKHLEDALTNGELCFCCPEVFSNITSEQLSSAQVDTWDSNMFYLAEDLYVYPMIDDKSEEVKYDKGIKVADKAMIKEISTVSKYTPFCCFRKVKENEISEYNGRLWVSLGNVVDRIKNEFKHDAFIFITSPDELISRIEKQRTCYGKSVVYGHLSSKDYDDIEKNKKRDLLK